MACIIHYENINLQNKTVKLSQKNLKTLQEIKEIGNKLGRDNARIQQSNNIADMFIDEPVDHCECCQKFIYAKMRIKRKN